VELLQGFTVEDPPLVIPWGIREDELLQLFPNGSLRHVTDGYYVTSCVSLGGRRHMLGFHLRPDHGGRLIWLEFYRDDAPLSQTYPDWQRRLEALLGKPHRTTPADCGYSRHEWALDPVTVTHTVVDRFGPEEHVHIALPETDADWRASS
jgi:hypothetical protein